MDSYHYFIIVCTVIFIMYDTLIHFLIQLMLASVFDLTGSLFPDHFGIVMSVKLMKFPSG